jgi:hypothetical protein
MSPFTKQAFPADQHFRVGSADHDRTHAWLNELPALLWRHAGLGIIQDVGQMDLAELHGVYQYLSHL